MQRSVVDGPALQGRGGRFVADVAMARDDREYGSQRAPVTFPGKWRLVRSMQTSGG